MKKKPEPALPFLRERIIAVGTLALLAPIPLAFTPALEVAPLLLYLAALAGLLLAVRRGRTPRLSNVTLNLVGLLSFFFFYFDLRHGSRSLMRATLHILLFVTVVKLTAIRKERDFSVLLTLTGFLFLAAVANSFHVSVLLYVAGFSLVAWPILVRWSLWRDLAAAPDEWTRDRQAASLPGPRATAVSVTGILLIALPFFVALPRLRAPYMRGGLDSREISTGFTESVDPDMYGKIKQSDRVFLRATTDEPISRLTASSLRFRALAYSRYENRTWVKGEREWGSPGAAGALIPLTRARYDVSRSSMTVDLTPLGSMFVPIPESAVAIRFHEATLRGRLGWGYYRDGLRNFRLSFRPDRMLRYDALYGGPPIRDLHEPSAGDPSRRALGSARVRDFVLQAAAGASPEERPDLVARRLEGYLSGRFTYSLEIARSGPSPVEEFLFERRSGPCEIFATAMAMGLREVGIPSRLVSGFAGGQIGLLGKYVLVRGRDAHAWVEAWLGPEKGWVTFDPTPPAGRPTLERVPWTQSLRQLSDGVEFFYDRFILSFSEGDQIELVRWVHETAGAAAEALRHAKERAGALFALGWKGGLLALGGAATVVLALALLVRRLRGHKAWFGGRLRDLPAGARAYRRLQRLLSRRGAPITPASAPGETLEAAMPFGPAVLGPSREIVTAYVAESFGGLPAGPDEETRLAGTLGAVREALRASRGH